MPHILVADDDLDQLRLQQALLEAMGYEVTLAQSTEATLESLAGRPVDVLVMDLRFPTVQDGLRLVHDVRAAGYALPIVLVSGWPDEIYGSPEEALVTRVVVKGSVRELLAVIAELIAGKTGSDAISLIPPSGAEFA